MKRITALLTVLSLIFSLTVNLTVNADFSDPDYTPVYSDVYNSPAVTPPADTHPRLLFKAEDIPAIKSGFTGINENAYNEFSKLLSEPLSGTLEDGKYNPHILALIEARAFDYAINGTEKSGNDAVSEIKNFLESYEFKGSERDGGYTLLISSEVYDWCYPLLSDADKIFFREKGVYLMERFLCRWPCDITIQGSVTGHGSEAMVLRDMFAFAIAVYDEYPDIYNYLGSYIEKEYVPVRNEWSKSASFHQGTSYGPLRYSFDMWAAWFVKRMSGKDLYSADMQYPLYQMLYYNNPAGFYIREGDDTPFAAIHGKTLKGDYIAFWLASNYYNDPYLKNEQLRIDPEGDNFSYTFDSMSPVQFLIINNPFLEPADLNELPKTRYFGSPKGMMVARTGWEQGNIDSSDAVVLMKIGEEYLANHQHLDFGTFSIYYKGNLTGDLGMYRYYGSDHDYNYNKETISHNGLLIYDPNEKMVQATVNSGGQRRKNTYVQDFTEWQHTDTTYGKVIAHDYDNKNSIPGYSYISGDITDSYSEKVSEVKRSMMFMPTDNPDKPAVFFVMDKIVSKNAGFKKTFLLQCMQEPYVEGNRIEIVRDNPKSGFNGKLTVQTLFPEKPEIVKQGGPGYQWFAGGRNILALDNDNVTLLDNSNITYGWGKVLVSPTEEKHEDYFLNAMYVSDADDSAVSPATSFETEKFIGAELENKIGLFAKASQKEDEAFSIEIPKTGSKDIAIAGLKSGNWSIYENGELLKIVYVTSDSGMMYFNSEGGSLSFEPEPQLDSPKINRAEKKENGSFLVSWQRVENAIGYKAEVVYGDETVFSEKLIKAESLELPESLSDGREYTVSVTAVSDKEELSSEPSEIKLNTLFHGGFGTEEYPYLIANAEELSNISQSPYASYRIISDIEETVTEPIEKFMGTLTGWDMENECEAQRSIDINMVSKSSQYLGLFKQIRGGTVKNLNITGSVVNGFSSGKSGGLTGHLNSGLIMNVTNNAALTVYNGSPHAGGIVGLASDGNIIGCVNNGNLSRGYTAGGIIGWSYLTTGDTVTKCCNTGTLSGRLNGGIIALSQLSLTVTDSCNLGSFNGGGIIGNTSSAATDKIILSGCFTLTSALAGSDDIVSIENSLPYLNSYYLSDETDGNGLSKADMAKKESFKNWDFENIWSLEAEDEYPKLQPYSTDKALSFESFSIFEDIISETELLLIMNKDLKKVKGKNGKLIAAKLSAEYAEIEEFGFSVSTDNGNTWQDCPSDINNISNQGAFCMYLYSSSESSFKIKPYAVYSINGIKNKKYGNIYESQFQSNDNK